MPSCHFEWLYLKFTHIKILLCCCSYNFTLTSDSSIIIMSVTTDSEATRAISEVTLTTTATNIVQVDWTSSATKMNIGEGSCIYILTQTYNI